MTESKHTPIEWVEFDPAGRLPPERRYVLVRAVNDGFPSGAICVGWLRIHSDGPFFVHRGIGSFDYRTTVTHYADCLGDDFHAPGWAGQHPAREAGDAGRQLNATEAP